MLAFAVMVLVAGASEPGSQAATGPPVTLVAVGDVMAHSSVKRSADSHGFESMFEGVAHRVRSADLAFANLETPVTERTDPATGKLVFNAPTTLTRALANTGFDVMSLANNHSYDQGQDGLWETYDAVLDAGMMPVGVGKTCEQAYEGLVVEIRGLRIGFMAATVLHNHYRDQDGVICVARFKGDPVLQAVEQLRQRVDVVVLSVHWGDEYEIEPNRYTRAHAKRLVDAGVDVLLGHHPHVLQPVEWMEAHDGRRALVAYSLGNFISGQGGPYRWGRNPVAGYTRDGLALGVSLDPATGAIVDATAHPLWTARRRAPCDASDEVPELYVVEVSQALAQRPTLEEDDCRSMLAKRLEMVQQVIGPDLTVE